MAMVRAGIPLRFQAGLRAAESLTAFVYRILCSLPRLCRWRALSCLAHSSALALHHCATAVAVVNTLRLHQAHLKPSALASYRISLENHQAQFRSSPGTPFNRLFHPRKLPGDIIFPPLCREVEGAATKHPGTLSPPCLAIIGSVSLLASVRSL
ncbi:hypothetical protein BU26DRAFT_294566 [Trematosphaeria pertusa]|uniref:Uncharacterized protein n=1 Tax=Trematosphaeria pertusa TaxID=390896 RepID=A0A6A6IKD9_9PLEO|nr:uncharacterized protein BU26DRAFT_294566 [Trematosphaeria pertusa]KAF2250030.1 hypothetical protein BU26DRAFT_294566 [Trematosphaeria pertusa]